MLDGLSASPQFALSNAPTVTVPPRIVTLDSPECPEEPGRGWDAAPESDWPDSVVAATAELWPTDVTFGEALWGGGAG